MNWDLGTPVAASNACGRGGGRTGSTVSAGEESAAYMLLLTVPDGQRSTVTTAERSAADAGV
jgi:hypothetical protein